MIASTILMHALFPSQLLLDFFVARKLVFSIKNASKSLSKSKYSLVQAFAIGAFVSFIQEAP